MFGGKNKGFTVFGSYTMWLLAKAFEEIVNTL